MDIDHYRIRPGQDVDLDDWDTRENEGFEKDGVQDRLLELNDELEQLQELLYAEGRHKVLVVIQATDTGGKDGTIRHVFDGVNPAGVRVAAFKKPSSRELAHDYLWRVHAQTPGNGELTIFNRSHYEDILVVRVHDIVPKERWSKRYEHIRNFEQMLADEGTTIVKLFLHISKDEQRERLQARVDEPHKNWKFSFGDLAEREHWDDYRKAFRAMLEETSTKDAPWYVIPADRKWFRNLLISEIMVQTLRDLDMDWPEPEEGVPGTVVDVSPLVEVATATPARLGECPVWSVAEQALYWTDIESRVVHRLDPVTGRDATRGFAGRVGTIALGAAPGELVLAIENGLYHYRWDDPASATPFARLEPDGNGNRSNDGRIDPTGRFVLGTMYDDASAGRSTGGLYRVDGDGVTTLRTGVGVPNGLAFDTDRGLVYWADTFTSRVIVADLDPDTGAWHDERTFFDYTDHPGRPDGACLDAEGGYWSASVGGGCVIRVTPDGALDERIEVPLEKPSMPAFGGADLDTLFVTTIGEEHGRPATPGQGGTVPGSLLAIEGIGVTGRAEPHFQG